MHKKNLSYFEKIPTRPSKVKSEAAIEIRPLERPRVASDDLDGSK